MTGRDLILYIIANGLENEPVYKDGKFIGMLSVYDAAAKMNVGPATISTLVELEKLEGVVVRSGLYIPAHLKLERK